MGKISRYKSALYIRNFVFGVEDSLVSTVGLISGIAIVNVPQETILLTGIVLVFVEAFSMGVGSFLSEHSAQDYIEKTETKHTKSIIGGVVMFFSYFVSGFIPLIPYLILETKLAFPFSIIISLVTLFLLGVLGAKISETSVVKSSLRMLIIGGIAIGLGIMVGSFVNGTTI